MTGDFFTEWSDKLDVSGAERRGGDGLPVRCFPLFWSCTKIFMGLGGVVVTSYLAYLHIVKANRYDDAED